MDEKVYLSKEVENVKTDARSCIDMPVVGSNGSDVMI